MEQTQEPHFYLRCPRCNRELAEITPQGLRIGHLTLLGLIKIGCGAMRENGQGCDGLVRWRCRTEGQARSSFAALIVPEIAPEPLTR